MVGSRAAACKSLGAFEEVEDTVAGVEGSIIVGVLLKILRDRCRSNGRFMPCEAWSVCV